MHFLCVMCPSGLHTVDFCVSPDPDTILDLVKCILVRMWSPTLKILRITCSEPVSATFPSNLFACLSQMMDLYFERVAFEPELIRKVKGLDNLHLMVSDDSEGTKELFKVQTTGEYSNFCSASPASHLHHRGEKQRLSGDRDDLS